MPPLIVVGPAALFLGVAFPVAVRCKKTRSMRSDAEWESYMPGTPLIIFRAFAGGFLLVPLLGTTKSGVILAGITAVASLALFLVIQREYAGCALRCRRPIGRRRDSGQHWRSVPRCPRFPIFCGNRRSSPTPKRPPRRQPPPVSDIPTSRQLFVNGYGMTALVTGNKLMAWHLPLWLSDSPPTPW